MHREVFGQFGRHDLAVQPLLQHVEALHPAVAHHQQLAVDGAGQMQRWRQIREAFGDVLAGAGIEPRLQVTVRVTACHRLHTNAIPFPFGDVVGRVEACEISIVDRMREHHGTEWRGIEIDRLVAASLEPREQVGVGRR